MATTASLVQYIIEMIELAKIPNIRPKKMFGEYGIYSDEIFFALICNDKLFLKGNKDSEHMYPDHVTKPYEGSKGYFYYPTDWLEDTDKLSQYCNNSIQLAILSKSKKKKL
jgi:TfoX/Sxy family transcriptional regulator of competence genes